MNNLSLAESVRRANSTLRYWRYRRSIGKPILLRTALREWITIFRHEYLRPGAHR